MGDPKRHVNTYKCPRHPWERDRIIEEKTLLAEYGLKNKKDIWKQVSLINKIKERVKKVNSQTGKGIDQEREALAKKLVKYNFLNEGQPLDDALELTPRDAMERRLQTVSVRQGLARTMKQARQFIVHGHITVNGKRITSPSYMVTKEEQFLLGFIPKSSFSDPEHPERMPSVKEVEEKVKKPVKDKAKKEVDDETGDDINLEEVGVVEDEVSKEISQKLEVEEDEDAPEEPKNE